MIRRNIPLAVVLIVIVAAVILVLADRWRRGAFIFGLATLLAALCRLTLPESYVGVLAVRGRWFDAAALGVVGGAIVFLSLSIDPLGTG